MRHRPFLLRDPSNHVRLENIERQRAIRKQRVVEGAQVKALAEFPPGTLSRFSNFHLPEFIGEGLSRPGNVTVYFRSNVGLIHGRVLAEIIHHLLARPVLGVYAGINHQAGGTPHLIFKTPIFAVRVLLEARLLAEPLSVKCPTLRVGVLVSKSAEVGQFGLLLGDGELQMVTGDSLVVGNGFHVQNRSMTGIVFIDVDAPWMRTITRLN